MNIHPFHHYPSTYIALALWGTMGFMAIPSIASFVVHFLIAPAVLALMLWVAHYEGRGGNFDFLRRWRWVLGSVPLVLLLVWGFLTYR